ncbi:mCG1034246 [Mus musculus]|nr:mCG1034246 [Mus musculus]
MGAEVRRQAAGTLHLFSGALILLNSLGSQAGLRHSSCPWMSFREEGTVIQILQP